MVTFKYKVVDPVGMHARPASKLVQELSKYKSSVIIKLDTKEANAKSIINLMALGIKNGNEIVFTIKGEDQDELLKELPNILANNNI